MKKRILCICMTAVLLISLTGCSAADTLTQLSVTYEKHLELYQKFHCDYFIQIDYLLEDEALTHDLTEQIHSAMKKYSEEIKIDNFRLIESGSFINVAFNMVYPAELQKREEEICKDIADRLESENPRFHTIIKGIIRRERFSLHR